MAAHGRTTCDGVRCAVSEEEGNRMPTLTRDDLDRLGLELAPEAFEQLVAEAVRGLPVAEHVGSPRHDLTAAEVAALEQGGFDLSPETPEELAGEPVARGVAEYAAMVGTALTPAQAARRLGIDVSRVRHRLAARTLYGIKTPHGWRLPLFQFDPSSGALPGVGPVLASLDPDLHPVSVQRWFLAPDPDLEVAGRAVSPRDWLRHGGAPSAIAPLALVA